MGGCCTRNEDINFDKKTSFKYPVIEEGNNSIMYLSKKPELKFEQHKLQINEEDVELLKIINKLKNQYKGKVKIITEIELFNLAIYYKDNYINSNYLIFDMRISGEQKEHYLKKIKHINYTFDQIKNIKQIKKFEVLQSFIDSKTIILIIPEYYLNPNNNKEGFKNVDEYPIEVCNLLYNINNNICFKILNTSLNKASKSSDKFEEYLSTFYSYDIVPFILFTYKHITTLYREGYFFISFLKKPIFSFEKYIHNLQIQRINNNHKDNNNEFDIKEKFIIQMNMTTIINIDNSLNREFEINDYQYKENVLKEIIINKKDLKNELVQVNSIIEWLKQEIKKGHSCYFNINNFGFNEMDNDIQQNNWIDVIIFFITLVTEVEYISVIEYLKEKMIYIEDPDKVFGSNINDDEIIDILSKYEYFK